MTTALPIAFVMMPFSTEFDAVYKGLIASALDGYNVIRADTQFDQRSILAKIVSGISEAHLIIADITALNPNVMYELGIAHTLGKPVIMITQNIDELPFDVAAYPIHEYSTHFQRSDDLSQKLRELSTRHRQGLVRFANPVTDFLGDPVVVARSDSAKTKATPATEPSPDESDDPDTATPHFGSHAPEEYGFLDFSADLEEHGGTALAQMQRLNDHTTALNVKLHDIAPRIVAARNSSASGSTSQARRLTNELAREFQAYARTIDKEVIPPFHESWKKVGRSLLWLLEHHDADTATSDDLQSLSANVTGLHEVLTSNVQSMADVRALFPMMRGQTSELTRAADEADRTITRLMGEYTLATSYLARIEEHLALLSSRHTSG